jgi:hypothetical protein
MEVPVTRTLLSGNDYFSRYGGQRMTVAILSEKEFSTSR